MKDTRYQQLTQWLSQHYDDNSFSIQSIVNDASFRRYFRVLHNGTSTIAMDAPPDKENNLAFVSVAKTFLSQDIHVPEIFHSDLEHGFLLLSDLGKRLYLNELMPENADKLYQTALNELFKIQQCKNFSDWQLPVFDVGFIEVELLRFTEWFLQAFLQLDIDHSKQQMLSRAFEILSESALAQPVVCVHRDYHSRNLLIDGARQIGVIDFQDAVWGPISYDLVSLLKDCYIDWPNEQVEAWALQYFKLLKENTSIANVSDDNFLYWFHMMGIQRHLKAIGIFARLNIRDGKAGYLKDMPRTLNYVINACEHDARLKPLQIFLREEVQAPLFDKLKMDPRFRGGNRYTE